MSSDELPKTFEFPHHVTKKADKNPEPAGLSNGIITPGRMRPVVIVLQIPETFCGQPKTKVWRALTNPSNAFRIFRGIVDEVVRQLGPRPLASELVEQVERAIIAGTGH